MDHTDNSPRPGPVMPAAAARAPKGHATDQPHAPRVAAAEQPQAADPPSVAERSPATGAQQPRRSQPKDNRLQRASGDVIRGRLLPFLEYEDQQALSLASHGLHQVADVEPAQDMEVVNRFRALLRLEEERARMLVCGTPGVRKYLDRLKAAVETIERDGANCLTFEFEVAVRDAAGQLDASLDYGRFRAAMGSRDTRGLVETLKAICENWPDDRALARARAAELSREYEAADRAFMERAPADMQARERRGYRTPLRDISILKQALEDMRSRSLGAADWQRIFECAIRVVDRSAIRKLFDKYELAMDLGDTSRLERELDRIIRFATRSELSGTPHREANLAERRLVVSFSESPIPADPSKPQTVRVSYTDTKTGEVVTREHAHTGEKFHESRIAVRNGSSTQIFVHRFNASVSTENG